MLHKNNAIPALKQAGKPDKSPSCSLLIAESSLILIGTIPAG
mgnify:CR=1 FL=1